MNKTNAMRQLDKAKIDYMPIEYEVNENDLSGIHIAEQTGLDPNIMFKTLVARGDKRGPLVFCIPVNAELDLKKCAKAAGDKRVELIAVKELLGLTGYIRGGCSPIGMKKTFPTFIDETAILFDEITVSAGVRGCQLMLDREKLINFIQANICDLTV
ncbi:MAG: Cys-tRNA(Pro) deacylase [Clostridia bacterium]|nr:Cys-tRNA(Pro) deacylase [Clostridia bacterium]MBO5912002.1 Cys-tRNA(Pro) deacylase [Clostridia bacterium]